MAMEGMPIPEDIGSLALVGAFLLFVFLRESGQAWLKRKDDAATAELEGGKANQAAALEDDQARRTWHEEQAKEAIARAKELTDKIIADLEKEKADGLAKIKALEESAEELKRELQSEKEARAKAEIVWAKALWLVEQDPSKIGVVSETMLRLGADTTSRSLPMPDDLEQLESLEEISAERSKRRSE